MGFFFDILKGGRWFQMEAKLCDVALRAEAGGPANPAAAGQPLGGRIRNRCLEAGKARVLNVLLLQAPLPLLRSPRYVDQPCVCPAALPRAPPQPWSPRTLPGGTSRRERISFSC